MRCPHIKLGEKNLRAPMASWKNVDALTKLDLLKSRLAVQALTGKKDRRPQRTPRKFDVKTRIREIRNGAMRRGIPMLMSDYEIAMRICGPCTYCGADVPEEEGFHGIDRMDNYGPYVASNAASACWECNRMKGAMTRAAFVSHAAKIAEKSRQATAAGQSAPK